MKRATAAWLIVGLLAAGWLSWRALHGGVGVAYVEPQAFESVAATQNDWAAGTAIISWPQTLGIWTAALMTLFILSFLYRDNPFYKVAEGVIVGVSAAYWMVVGFWTTLVPNLFGKLAPQWVQSTLMPGLSPVADQYWWVNIIPLLLGVMLLWRLMPRGGWIARWPLAFIIGTTAGLRLVTYLQADFVSQIQAGVEPIVVVSGPSAAGNFWLSVQNSLIFFSTLAALVYFTFSLEHKGIVGGISRVGIWVLMITFGAAFGYAVMGRIALLALRFEFLFDNWLWLIDPYENRLMN